MLVITWFLSEIAFQSLRWQETWVRSSRSLFSLPLSTASPSLPSNSARTFAAQQRALSTKIQQDDMHRLHRWPPSPRAARWYSMIFNDIHRWSPTPTAALSSKIAFQLNLLTGFKCCISKHFGANICFLFPTIKVWGRGVGCHLITKVCHYNTQSEGPRGWVVRVQ